MKHFFTLLKASKFFWLLLFSISIVGPLSAQIVVMPSTGIDTVTSCTSVIQDPGGNGNYPSYSYGTLIIDPPGNESVSITFSSFTTFSSSDYVAIYDGAGISGSTWLGNYWGSNIPNSGNSITASSGAMTLIFGSNCCSNSAGFVATYSTGNSTVPTANFVASTSSPAYNTMVNFVNTTSGGGTYLWDFGDGITSTEENPSHRYTTTGAQQVTLVASNCTGSDTSAITTLNVQAAPQGSLSVDTVALSLACGTSGSSTFSVSNSAAGNLSYSLSLQNSGQNYIVNESFENGLGSFSSSSTSYTQTFGTTNAPHGSQYLTISGSDYFNAYESNFSDAQPGTVSYSVRSDTYANYHGEFGVADADVFGNRFRLMYSVFRYNQLRFYYKTAPTGFVTVYNVSQTDGTWYDVELRNIDWTSESFDIYVNGTLEVSNAYFMDNGVTSVNQVYFTNNYFSTTSLDAVSVGNLNPNSIFSYSPTTGNLGNNSNNSVIVNANTTGLNAGTYLFEFAIASNDTALDGTVLPLKLEVTGDAQLVTSASCNTMGKVFTGISYSDSLLITNSGCDTLNFSGVAATSTDIAITAAGFNVAPNDTTYFSYTVTPSSVGSFNDTVTFSGADTLFKFCITGNAVTPPAIATDSVAYTLNYFGCTDSALIKIPVGNTGADTLNWSTSGSNNLSDDFETGTFNTNLWQSVGLGVGFSTNCGVASGNFSAIFLGGTSQTRYMITKPMNLTGVSQFEFTLQQTTSCNRPESSEGITVEYSLNGGSTWNYMNYYYPFNGVTQQITVSLPSQARTSNVQIRFIQNFHTGSLDVWLLDDFNFSGSVVSGTSGFSTVMPDTGNLSANAYDTIYAYIPIDGLTSGTYPYVLNIYSNDPTTPVLNIPVTLNLQGVPNLEVAASSCINLDTLIAGNSVSDSILIYNDGCADINPISYSFSNSDFSLTQSAVVLAAGDSTYIQYNYSPTSGPQTISDELVITTNFGTDTICFDGYVQGAPVAYLDTNDISLTINSCDDSVNVQRYLGNSGLSALDYKILGSQGGAPLQDILDAFKANENSITSLIPNRYLFFDGVTGNNISDGGGDMYDGGNYLNTDLAFGIPYSNDLVVQSTSFGPSGSYFTYKGQGIFIMAADLDNVNEFRISGNLGADGSGSADDAILTRNQNGTSYTGYVKRVYSAGDPSINHLIITETNSSITRTRVSGTGSENHRLTGLTANDRIYYILFAGSGGSYINNNVFQDVMNQFLGLIGSAGLPEWITASPDSGAVAINDSSLLDFWVKSQGLPSGLNTGQIVVTSNDPQNPSLTINVNLTVNGSAEAVLVNSGCLNYSSVQQGVSETQNARIYNSGCDTLRIDSASFTNADFSVMNLPIVVAPEDTISAEVMYTPSAIGSFADTATLYTNDTNVTVCLSGSSVGAADVDFPIDSLHFTLNKCKVIGNANFRINNNGAAAMNYDLSFGQFQGSSRQTYNTVGATTIHQFNNVPALTNMDTIKLRVIVHGDFDQWNERPDLYINNNYYTSLYTNNVSYQNDTLYVNIWGWQASNYTSGNSLTIELRNRFDVDGGAGSFHDVQVITKTSNPVNWVAIVGATSGSVAANAGVNKNILFNAASLPAGIHRTFMGVETNSPGNPFAMVPIILNVVEEPDFGTTDTCLLYPLTLVGDTTVNTFSLYNDGCASLNLASITSTNSAFKIIGNTSNQTLQIGDSAHFTVQFIPNASGNYSASIIAVGNGEVLNICLNGTSGALPVSAFNTSPEDVCIGEVSFIDLSQNNPTNYFWQFGDGNTSVLPNPTHSYTKPGTYKVTMRTSNNFGFDTLSQNVTVNPLWIAFSASADTVEMDSVVSFYDSSLTATTWSWDFGDGSSDLVQNPTHTYSTQGTFTVTLTVTDARGCSATITKNVYVVNSIGINEFSLKPQFNLYPNPSRGEVVVSSYLGIGKVSVFGFDGKVVFESDFLNQQEKQTLYLQDLATGVYTVQAYDRSGKLLGNKKLIIQNQ